MLGATTNRIQDQTTEEWLADYFAEENERQDSICQSHINSNHVRRFIYVGHRTSHCPGKSCDRLILEFEDMDTGAVAVAFFNVSVRYERGKKRGQPKKSGTGGQFLPPRSRSSKFYKFWMDSIGVEPRRWATVHKELKPKLKGLVFTAEVERQIDRSGGRYHKLLNLKVFRQSQLGNNGGTGL